MGNLPPHTEAVGVPVPGPRTVRRLLVQPTGRRDEGLEAGRDGGPACLGRGVLAREARRSRGTEQPFSWAESGKGSLTSWAPWGVPVAQSRSPTWRVTGSPSLGKPITQHKAFLQRGVSLASASGADPLGRPAPSPSGSGPGWVPRPTWGGEHPPGPARRRAPLEERPSPHALWFRPSSSFVPPTPGALSSDESGISSCARCCTQPPPVGSGMNTVAQVGRSADIRAVTSSQSCAPRPSCDLHTRPYACARGSLKEGTEMHL